MQVEKQPADKARGPSRASSSRGEVDSSLPSAQRDAGAQKMAKNKLASDRLDDDWVMRRVERARTLFAFDASEGALDIPHCSRTSDHGDECAVSLARHVGQQLVESVYGRHASQFLANKCIGIHCANPFADGIGDVISLSKMAKILESTGARVVLLNPGRDERLRHRYFPFIEDKNVIALSQPSPLDPLAGVDVVIVARGTDIGPRYGCFYSGADDSTLRVPQLNVLEYNVHAMFLGPDVMETGFSARSVGFFRDAELYEMSQLDLLARGRRKDEIYGELLRARCGELLGESGEWPPTRPTAIHTSYCTWSLKKIIDVSAHVHAEEEGDLTLQVVSKLRWERQKEDAEENIAEPPPGYAQLTIDAPGLHLSLSAAEVCPETAPTKRMTVRGFSQLPPETFSALTKLSDFMIVTGDQSVSEAISLGVPFAYQCCFHKHELQNALKKGLDLSGAAQKWQRWLLGGCPEGSCPSHLTASVRQELVERSMHLARTCDLSENFLARVMRRIGGDDFDDLRRYEMFVNREVRAANLDKSSQKGLGYITYFLEDLSEQVQKECGLGKR